MDKTIRFEIPTKYLIYGGAAVALGLAYWYLKANGYWDQWFNSAGALVPAPPIQSGTSGMSAPGFTVPGTESAAKWVN